MTGSRVDAGAGAESSGSVTSLLEWRRRTVFASANAGLTAFGGGGWSVQGLADASYFVTSGRGVAGELVGALEAMRQSEDFGAASVRVEPRLHVIRQRAGAWLGAAVAGGWTSDISNLGLGPSTGVWARRGPARGALTFVPLRVEGAWYPEVNAFVALTAGPVDAVGYVGWRGADDPTGELGGAWGGLTASWWLGPRSAVTFAAGSFPADLLQDLASARYVSVGFRFASRRPAIPVLRPLGRPVYERESEGMLRLQFRVPDATTVAIAGDWTDWQRIPMQRISGDTWELVIAVPSGIHRFNLIVDGERWIVPPGVPRVSDGFGGAAGILVVPE